MKTKLLIPLLLLLSVGAAAQNWGNMAPYPGPSKKALTPAPEGYTPFYISHFGRHGSRYLTEQTAYVFAIGKLDSAAQLGILKPKGEAVLETLQIAYADALQRDGELSALGARQHREIAARMYERFPELLSQPMEVDAKSSTSERCILSMINFCQELQGLNPALEIGMKASRRDMRYVVGDFDRKVEEGPDMPALTKQLEAQIDKCFDKSRLMKSLFTDVRKAESFIDERELAEALYEVASDLPNVPHLNLSLADVFSRSEWPRIDKAVNAALLLGCGVVPGSTPVYQMQLEARDSLVSIADRAIRSGKPSLTLRFSHDAAILPLAYLMGIREAGIGRADLVIPMAANIQLVFYRKEGSDDVLVKFLLNENETSLPAVKTDRAPYYHWADVKRSWGITLP